MTLASNKQRLVLVVQKLSLIALKQILGLLFLWVLLGPSQASADVRYKAYASRLISALPAASVIRPDLERRLERLSLGERAKRGRRPLKSSDALRAAARGQAAEMILGNFVGHHTKGGFDFGDRFRAYLPKFEGLRGENAARDRRGGASDKRKADRVFKQWLNSPRHLRNLINSDYAYVSTGVIMAGAHLYAVQIFWENPPARTGSNWLIID